MKSKGFRREDLVSEQDIEKELGRAPVYTLADHAHVSPLCV